MGQEYSLLKSRPPTVLGSVDQSFEFSHGQLEDAYDAPRVAKLGSGTFGTVWRGKHRATQQFRAIKTLEKGRLQTLKLGRDEVLMEVQLLRQCCHKNIVQSFEAYETHRQFHFVLEYCDGGDLQNRVVEAPNGSISEETVAQWMRQVLEAIAYLHADSRKICHRDIKPHNFMFSGEMLKLGDFGIAIKTDGMLKEKIGSPAFMAPELHLLPDRSTGYDHKVDVWAAGVVMVFLLSAHCPFVDSGGRLRKEDIIQGRVPLWEDDKYFGLFRAFGIEEGPSQQGRDLVRALLMPDRRKRVTAANAVSHEWFAAQENGTLLRAQEPMALLSLDDFQSSVVGNFMHVAKGIASEGLLQAQRGLQKLHSTLDSLPVQEGFDHAKEAVKRLGSHIEELPVPALEGPINLQHHEESLSQCCVCYNDTAEFDYVCNRCKHAVCYECLPQLRMLECPYCRKPSDSMRAERGLIRLYTAGLNLQSEVAKTLAKAEETKLPTMELHARVSAENLEMCVLCKEDSTMFDFTCPKCGICVCSSCTVDGSLTTEFGEGFSSSSDASPHSNVSPKRAVFVTPLSSHPEPSPVSSYLDTQSVEGGELVDISLDGSPCRPALGAPAGDTHARRWTSSSSAGQKTVASCPNCANTVEFCAALEYFRTAQSIATSTKNVFSQLRSEFVQADYRALITDLGQNVQSDLVGVKDAVVNVVGDTTSAIQANVRTLAEARVTMADCTSQPNGQNAIDELERCVKCTAASGETDFACPGCSAVICQECSAIERTRCVKCQNDTLYASALSRHVSAMDAWESVRSTVSGLTSHLSGFFE